MDKRIVICAVIFLVLAVLGVLAYTNLEIYSRKTYSPPSGETLANSYFALERWLNETGHSVRIEKQGSPAKIAAAPERVALVLAAACKWEDAKEILIPWIEQGGFLVISLDESVIDKNLMKFISEFGIGVQENLLDENPGGDTIPDFYWRDIYFSHDDDAEIFTINDSMGYARLVEVYSGEGALTVIGRPRFMYNNNLERDINAGLSWGLTGARANGENTGILFIRNRYISKSLFGKIMDRGNIVPIIVSAVLVIVLGFWMVVPVFGLVFGEKQKTARPIRERFLAETRFFRKYGALNHYLEVYKRELKLKGNGEKRNEPLNHREIIKELSLLQNSVSFGTASIKKT